MQRPKIAVLPKLSIWLEKLKFLVRKFRRRVLAANNLALMVALLFCLMWLWGSVSAMSRNWELARRVEERKRERTLLKLEVETLELENKYYKSAEYQELSARRQHNKILPGETMLLLPKNSEAAKNKHRPAKKVEPKPLGNFQQWMLFLFGWQGGRATKN